MQDVGGRGGRNMESALKFQRAWERFGFQDRESSQSVFGKPVGLWVGGRGGGRCGRGGRLRAVCSKKE